MYGDSVQRGEENLRPVAGAVQIGVAAIAQPLVILGISISRQSARIDRRRGRTRHWFLGQEGKFADPGDRVAAVRDGVPPTLPSGRDPLLDDPAVQPASFFSMSWNHFQAACASSSVRFSTYQAAAGRVDHPGHMRLVHQQCLGVSGDPAGKGIRQAQRGIEGQHGDRLGTANTRTKTSQRRTQHVDPRVAAGHHRRRRHRVLPLRSYARTGATDLGHPRP